MVLTVGALSQEIYEHIIDFCDLPTLRICSLTCKTFLPRSRFKMLNTLPPKDEHISRRLTVSPMILNSGTQVHKLIDCIESPLQTLTPSIRCLGIIANGSWRASMQALFQALDDAGVNNQIQTLLLWFREESHIPFLRDLIAERFPNITHLIIRAESGGLAGKLRGLEDWTRVMHEVFSFQVQFPRLTRLDIQEPLDSRGGLSPEAQIPPPSLPNVPAIISATLIAQRFLLDWTSHLYAQNLQEVDITLLRPGRLLPSFRLFLKAQQDHLVRLTIRVPHYHLSLVKNGKMLADELAEFQLGSLPALQQLELSIESPSVIPKLVRSLEAPQLRSLALRMPGESLQLGASSDELKGLLLPGSDDSVENRFSLRILSLTATDMHPDEVDELRDIVNMHIAAQLPRRVQFELNVVMNRDSFFDWQ